MQIGEKSAHVLLRNIRVSPRKLNLVAQSIRGLKVDKAIKALQFSQKRIAVDVLKALRSATANAEMNHGLDVDSLYVDQAFVGKGILMKRFHPRGRSRGGVVKKLFSQLRIVVTEKQEEIKEAKTIAEPAEIVEAKVAKSTKKTKVKGK